MQTFLHCCCHIYLQWESTTGLVNHNDNDVSKKNVKYNNSYYSMPTKIPKKSNHYLNEYTNH